MFSQTMLFSFPFLFVCLSVDLLILTYLVMRMTNEETSMDHHQGLAARLVKMSIVIEMKVFGKANVQVLCIRSMNSLFYKLSCKPFYFLNPKMLTVKTMRPSSLSCASACNHC